MHIQCRNAALPLLFVCHCTWVVSTRHKSDLLFQREAQNKAQCSCSFWIFCCLQALLEIQTVGNQESSQCCTSFHPHPNAATNQLQSPTVQLPKTHSIPVNLMLTQLLRTRLCFWQCRGGTRDFERNLKKGTYQKPSFNALPEDRHR